MHCAKNFGRLAALTLVVTGCATIAAGSTQSISVSANVDDAQLFLDGELIGTTPFTGVVAKNKDNLRIEAEGYRTETLQLSKSLEPIFWGNIIIGGTLGSITDFATGAAYQYAPASYQVVLQEDGQDDFVYIRELAVRKFAMLYIDVISRELAAGGGEHLDALVTLSRSEDGRELDRTEIEVALTASQGDQVTFGRLVVDSI